MIHDQKISGLRRLQREQDPKSPFVFTSERGAPFTKGGFARMVKRAGGGRKLAPHEWRCGPTADGGRACRTSSFLRKHLTLYFVFRCGPSALTRNGSGVR